MFRIGRKRGHRQVAKANRNRRHLFDTLEKRLLLAASLQLDSTDVDNSRAVDAANLAGPSTLRLANKIGPAGEASAIQRGDLANRANDTQTFIRGPYYNPRVQQSFGLARVINTSATAISSKLVLLIDNISDPSVTPANPDGITPDGKPFYELSDLVAGDQLDAGERTQYLRLLFNNPLRRRFNLETSVYEKAGTAQAASLRRALVQPSAEWIPLAGNSPTIANSSATLQLDLNAQRFAWQSNDPVLGQVDTQGGISAVRWFDSGPRASRRVFFLATHDGFRFQGSVRFDAVGRGIVDVAGPRGRVRYLLEGLQIADTDPAPLCALCCTSAACETEDTGGSSEDVQTQNNSGTSGPAVQLYNGSFRHSVTDLRIPGRGFDWSFSRTYRSDVSFHGPLGFNWEFNYQRKLRQVNAQNLAEFRVNYPNAQIGDLLHMDGYNRADFYLQNGTVTPQGFYRDLVQNPDNTFRERDADGMIVTYLAPDASGVALLSSMTDRDGNVMTFQYDSQNRLTRVVDTLGRPIDYIYSPSGLLTEVRDFIGRSIRFEYDANLDLLAVTSPTVTGAPNGNDFVDGKTERYSYITGFADPRRNHKLLTITAPNEVASGGPPRLVLTYDPDPPAPHIGRVLTQTIGGTNVSDVPAGGTITYDYQQLAAPADGNDATTATRQTTVTDRNGNVTEYQFNQFNNILRTREFNNRNIRPGDPVFYETSYAWNKDYQLLATTRPVGNNFDNVFDTANPDRFQQGNPLTTTMVADPRGGDQATITSSSTYEPIYNQVRLSTEARGNDPAYAPPNGGANSPGRYTTSYTFDYQEGAEFAALAAQIGITAAEVQQRLADAGVPMGLGDLNGDGITNQIEGHVIRVDQPTVNLLPGSNQAGVEGDTSQEIVSLFAFNQFGQLIRRVDPEGNVSTYEYFPENDPDGDGTINNPAGNAVTGGYLRQVTTDTTSDPIRNSSTNPTPANIRTRYSYDPVGNVIREVDGRGIATGYFVNELNQVVQTVRAAEHNLLANDPAEPLPLTDFQYLSRLFYDFNDNVVVVQSEDRGNTSGVDGNPPAPDLPNVPGGFNPDPFGDRAFVDTIFKYDILDNQIETLEEVANDVNAEFLRTRYRYDSNENQVLTISPEGNARSAIYDERDLLFRTTRGALTPPELDPASAAGTAATLLAPADPTDYNVRGGVTCQCTTFRYDANRNLVETVDSDDTDLSADNNSDIGPGDRTRYIYDGFDRLTSVIDSVGNQTVHQYDPASNVVRTLRFGPVGGASPTSDGPGVLPGPVSTGGVIQSANLVNSNLLEGTETLYDELSRTLQTDRVLFVNTLPTVRPPDVADGATDIGKGNLTPGDTQAIPGVIGINILGRVSNRFEYDRNSRTTFIVEDDEDSYEIRYDGANRVIETVDPEGNRVETAYDDNHNVIETRETDVAQVPGVADEQFLTTYVYDSLNRLQRTVDNVGQAMFYRYDSRDNMVAMADAQGPLTGATITRRAFSDGPLTVNAINDFGNVTRYTYDGISRQTRQEVILTELPPPAARPATASGDGIHIGASIFGVKDDVTAAESFTPVPDTGGPDGVPQAGGDGIIRTGYTYDDNSLLSSLVDDQGNITTYLYDNLDRRVVETKGLIVTSPFTETFILGDRRVVTPTAATIDDPLFIPESQIQNQLDAAKLRIDVIAPLFLPLSDDVTNPPPPPQATTIVYGYDPNDNVLILEDENDSEVFTRYDAINRAIATRVFRSEGNPSSVPADSHLGDPIFALNPADDLDGPHRGPFPPVIGTNAQDYQYDGLSRLVLGTDNNDPVTTDDDSTVTQAYDSLSRVIEETEQIGALASRATSSAWRAENLRRGLTYPNDRQLDYTYDGLDRMNTVADVGAALPIADYDYIGTSRVLVRSYPQNGTRMTYLDDTGTLDSGYDGLRRPVQLRHLRTDNSLVVGFTHDYDRMNNKLSEEKLHDGANSEVYTYDSAYRLVDFDRANAGAIAPLHSDWRLDGVGNWDQVNSVNRDHSSFNELLDENGSGFTYDDNGNQTRDPFGGQNGNVPLTYQWDYLNRLRRVTREADSTVVAEYSYDGLDRRIRKEVTGGGADNDPSINGTTDFYYDGWRVVEQRDAADGLTQQYVYGIFIDQPVVLDVNSSGGDSATDPADERLFYHQNTIQSVFALTDQTASILEGYLYDAYGRHTLYTPGVNGIVDFGNDDVVTAGASSALQNPYSFTGRRLDAESGDHYYRMRYLDSQQGRFLSRDPVGYLDGPNLYEYAQSSPTGAVDPFGLSVSLTNVRVKVLLQLKNVSLITNNTPLNRAKAMCYKMYRQRLVNLVGDIGWTVMTTPVEVVAGKGFFGPLAKGVSDALGKAETAEKAAKELLSRMTDVETGAWSTRGFQKNQCGCDMFLFWNKKTNTFSAYFQGRVSSNLTPKFKVQCCHPYEDFSFTTSGKTKIVTKGIWPFTWTSLEKLTNVSTR